ncbi:MULTISPECIES: Ku protein [unclassified Brevundimonas]|uniref:non-homologous end joining protein Ku n=1 Tax=unclassified Brevundimonas TaxID=2622653 RepID=UPI000CFD1908|nr:MULTISPECIES: Ku protein [unclassified Brevundimonas]PRA36681.1 Ku protein [Brevundimonas sp. MYb27]PQZ79459.1 Ku protein [Brevundimonas sp. MYb31]PRB13021.1 Ku protein [Brevundimonas sp. MYb52]PRB33622.1 Ku protein [Brevundimonas sp. MYb46]PRB48930.1 Ku protein [Brevundimonas sp. MYb33]
MATRPTWQGHLKLSLVTCPVALYTATSSASDVRFHLINPATHNRIRMVTTDPDTGPVERSDLVKGYEVAKDEYVLFDEADFDKVRLESTKTIAIDQFVDEADIDRLYWDDPFYVVPEKGVGVEAFAVIREAMKSAGKIALGQLVLRGKERQLALEVHGKGLVAYTLRAHDEVKDADDFFDDIPAVKADADMVEIAARIIGQKEADFDPTRFHDGYDEALKEMIKAKQAGGKGVVAVVEPDDTNVIDLMAALKASLKGPGAAKSAPKTKAAPKKKAG